MLGANISSVNIVLKHWILGICEEVIKNVSEIGREELQKGKRPVFNVTFDEMIFCSCMYEWDKNTHKGKGLADAGEQLNESDEEGKPKIATKVVVFMLVNLNGGFKETDAYYLL